MCVLDMWSLGCFSYLIVVCVPLSVKRFVNLFVVLLHEDGRLNSVAAVDYVHALSLHLQTH
jgi:hypothetical protein